MYISPSSDVIDLPDPPATEVVNAALQLFAICLPLQTARIQESILEQMTSFLAANSLQRDVNRKSAIMVNIAYAILSALKVAVKETRSAPGSLKGGSRGKSYAGLVACESALLERLLLLTFTAIHCPARPIYSQSCRRGFGSFM